jgi:hypothetical protein
MNQNSLERALIALSERSQVSQQLLTTHLQQAQDQLHEARNQLANVESRLDHLLCVAGRLSAPPEPPRADDAALSLAQKLDLLESTLDRAAS